MWVFAAFLEGLGNHHILYIYPYNGQAPAPIKCVRSSKGTKLPNSDVCEAAEVLADAGRPRKSQNRSEHLLMFCFGPTSEKNVETRFPEPSGKRGLSEQFPKRVLNALRKLTKTGLKQKNLFQRSRTHLEYVFDMLLKRFRELY